MDARTLRFALAFGACLLAARFAPAAEYRTTNFVAKAPTDEFARRVAMTAEQWRVRLAKEWLGKELPNWSRPCPIDVKVGQIGAGGATTFNFDRGEVYGWRMEVQGTEERILDSVIPHEVSHTIFASYFRRPLPRWADEGAATLAEHESEQRRQQMTLKQVWGTTHKIPLSSLLGMKEYPTDMRDVMTLYAEGYALADFLVQMGGRKKYLQFLDDAERQGWDTAIRKHYRFEGVANLESKWGAWVVAGSPDLGLDRGSMVASTPAADGTDIRGQSPDDEDSPVSGAARPVTFSASDFLEPARPAAPARTAEASGSGKERRPAPLGGFSGAAATRGGATETSLPSSADDAARSLPRTIRSESTAAASSDDFFGRDDRPTRVLGLADFPGASVVR